MEMISLNYVILLVKKGDLLEGAMENNYYNTTEDRNNRLIGLILLGIGTALLLSFCTENKTPQERFDYETTLTTKL